jgi:hypothetical protein
MSTSAVRRPATARDITLEVVRNMREGLEPLHYTTLPPAIYHIYLTYRMAKNQIVIGRGGRDYWTDLKLTTLPDVSREHVRLCRDAESGEFFIKDLSRLGTSVDGKQIPTSVEYVDGEKRDKNVEVKLPAAARIGLAAELAELQENLSRAEKELL